MPNPELREKLREKLKEKKLQRTSKIIRNNMMEDLEKKIEETRNPEKKKKLKKDLKLLEEIEEKELAGASEFPEYADTACYGGGLEHPD